MWWGTYIAVLHAHHVDLDAIVAVWKRACEIVSRRSAKDCE